MTPLIYVFICMVSKELPGVGRRLAGDPRKTVAAAMRCCLVKEVEVVPSGSWSLSSLLKMAL